jgi:hypothetical protein
MAPSIAIFGSRVRDTTVDVDLPDLYRDDPDLRASIRFHGNDPIIKLGATIAVPLGNRSLLFRMKLVEPSDDSARRELHVDVGSDHYYRLQGGHKYDLDTAPDWGRPPAGSIELPCRRRSWGGGGINLAAAARGMSSERTTPIIYLDTARPLLEKQWYKDLWQRFRDAADTPSRNWEVDLDLVRGLIMAAIAKNDREATAEGKVSADDLRTSVEGVLGPYLDHSGERAYRLLAHILSVFDPLESVDLALTRMGVRFAMVRGVPFPAPFNLVFAQVRDRARSINDKMIFRGHRGALESTFKNYATELLKKEVPDPGLIVLNTVYDTPLFLAGLDWAIALQAQQVDEGRKKDEICPVVLVLTRKNLAHIPEREAFELAYTRLRNLYVLFNEAEFGDYITTKDPKRAAQFLKRIEAGLPPELEELDSLLDTCWQIISRSDQHFIVTFGSLGSFGVSHTHVVYVGTYAVRDKQVLDTSGCGDAYAGGVSLLVYHKHNHRLEKLARRGYLSHGLTTMGPRQIEDFTLMMQVGAAAAYAKATDPFGIVGRRSVVSLLENEFLPTSDPTGLGDLRNAKTYIPHSARRVGLSDLLRHILDARPDRR